MILIIKTNKMTKQFIVFMSARKHFFETVLSISQNYGIDFILFLLNSFVGNLVYNSVSGVNSVSL